MKRVDVAIVGASLAGAACLRELTRLGVEAAAFERDAFPRERVCGGFLSPGATDILDELGVLPVVKQRGAVNVHDARVRIADREFQINLPRPGLGVSRRTLDSLMADHPAVVHSSVRDVQVNDSGFNVLLEDRSVAARVVVDAAGKSSRLTPHPPSDEFGVQFYQPDSSGETLDFWFFEDGYGGSVTIEDGRSNACFLIRKEALPKYLQWPGCRVTGPVAYSRAKSKYIAVGDAAGMVDPFCGEGMRHALDSGRIAAGAIARGLARKATYAAMRQEYEAEHGRRWTGKRALGALARAALHRPHFAARLVSFGPDWWARQLWR